MSKEIFGLYQSFRQAKSTIDLARTDLESGKVVNNPLVVATNLILESGFKWQGESLREGKNEDWVRTGNEAAGNPDGGDYRSETAYMIEVRFTDRGRKKLGLDRFHSPTMWFSSKALADGQISPAELAQFSQYEPPRAKGGPQTIITVGIGDKLRNVFADLTYNIKYGPAGVVDSLASAIEHKLEEMRRERQLTDRQVQAIIKMTNAEYPNGIDPNDHKTWNKYFQRCDEVAKKNR